MVFSSVAIPLCISGGPYFTYSACSPSSPTLFWFFMLLVFHACVAQLKLTVTVQNNCGY